MKATFGQLSHAGISVKIAMGQEAGATSKAASAVISVELGLLSEVEHEDPVAPPKARARLLFRSNPAAEIPSSGPACSRYGHRIRSVKGTPSVTALHRRTARSRHSRRLGAPHRCQSRIGITPRRALSSPSSSATLSCPALSDYSHAARERFRALGLKPKKSFGQNFLADPRIAHSIAELATTPEGGTVVEIGAGLGALTGLLLERAGRVVAVERDRDLCPILRESFAEPIEQGRLELVEADAAALDYLPFFQGQPKPHVLAGNLPYQITGKLLELASQLGDALDRAVFMVQREVADRLVAQPGTASYGALTVFVGAAFRVERALHVHRGAFFPSPDVDSSVVLLTPERRAEETPAFRAAVRAAFAQRRKTLRNAWRGLGPAAQIEERARRAGIDLDRRGETLSVEDFARFAEG